MSYYAVNIGANDGVVADPLFPLLEQHPETFGVLQIEGADDVSALKRNMARFPRVTVRAAKVYHSNIREIAKDSVAIKRHGIDGTKTMDFLKVDIDGCDCHMLSELMKDRHFHAKVIQIEINHHIPPPIAYVELCATETFGRASSSLDVWGCSMQAAYNIVKEYGYELLQHDWPDAVFVHQKYRHVFPCLLGDEPGTMFAQNYWIGYHHAKENYARWRGHMENVHFVESTLPTLAMQSYLHPEKAVENIYENVKKFLVKRPLLVNVSIDGAGRTAKISADVDGLDPTLSWYGA